MSLHHINSEGNLNNTYKRGKSLNPSILKKYKITQKMIANWFNYSSPNSFTGSKAKQDMLKGIESILYYIETIE